MTFAQFVCHTAPTCGGMYTHLAGSICFGVRGCHSIHSSSVGDIHFGYKVMACRVSCRVVPLCLQSNSLWQNNLSHSCIDVFHISSGWKLASFTAAFVNLSVTSFTSTLEYSGVQLILISLWIDQLMDSR